MSDQGTGPRGKQSMAQKRGSSRHGLDTIPAASPVEGASGKRENEHRHTSGAKKLEHVDHYTGDSKKDTKKSS